ncbi:hypothetical protein BC833DRAFT_163252 [Globomyces pollinis-pini]|nr:hypothetical protein BC833DRAFT_163252 [Globomyces pollinis-pini]
MNKQNQPNLVPERKSEKGNTVSLSDDISSSLDISKSEPVTTTNLESLLKKLLKGKRVRYESNLDSEDYSSLHNIIKDNAVDESDDSTTSFSHFEPFIKSTKHKDKNTIEKKKKLHNLRSFDDVPQRYIDDLNKPKRKDMNTSTTELKTVHHRSTSPVKIQNEMKSRLLSKKIGEDQPIRFDRSTQNSFRNSIIEKINSFNNSASDKLMRSELHDTAPEPALLYSQADTNLENIRQRKKKTVPRTDSHTINQHKGHNQSTSISYNHVHRHIPTPSSPVKVMEPVSTSDFSCTCPTCSSQSISWVCPGCVSDVSNSTNPLKNIPNPGILTPDSSHIKANPSASLNVSMIPKDSSILFANDTSMIKSLMDVVSEIESSPLKCITITTLKFRVWSKPLSGVCG